MAISKTAKASSGKKSVHEKPQCPNGDGELIRVLYTGFGKRGYYWDCEKANCGFSERKYR